MDGQVKHYGADPETGQAVVVTPDGTVTPLEGEQSYASDTAPRPALSGSLPAPPDDESAAGQSSGSTGSYGGGGYTPRRYSGGSGYSRGYSSGYSSHQPPNYGNDSQHPFFGGAPLTPGGTFANDSGGYDNREQVHVPGGASAGPFDTSAAGGGYGGAGGYTGGGGGGGPSDLYWQLKSKLEGAIGGGSSGSSSYPTTGAAPARSPREPKMTGKYAHGLDPSQALGLAYRPTAMLGRALKGVPGASPLYERASEIPAYTWAQLSKRNFSGSPKSIANSLGRTYANFGKGKIPSTDTMLKNLAHPKSGGGIDQMFNGVKDKSTESGYAYGQEPMPAGEQAYTYAPMLDAALSATLPTATAAKYGSEGYGGFLLDKATLKVMKKPPGKGPSVNQRVGKKLKLGH